MNISKEYKKFSKQTSMLSTQQKQSKFLQYPFYVTISKLTTTELLPLDQKTLKILTQFKFHNPLSDVNNLYLSKDKGV